MFCQLGVRSGQPLERRLAAAKVISSPPRGHPRPSNRSKRATIAQLMAQSCALREENQRAWTDLKLSLETLRDTLRMQEMLRRELSSSIIDESLVLLKRLTKRERRVLTLIAGSYSTKQI